MRGPLAMAEDLRGHDALSRRDDAGRPRPTRLTGAPGPALADVKDELAGGLWFPHDEIGDAYEFTRELERVFVANGGAVYLIRNQRNRITFSADDSECSYVSLAKRNAPRASLMRSAASRD